jgi:hypothetical protein
MVLGREGELNMKRKISFLITSLFCLSAPVWVFCQSAPPRDAPAGPPLSLAKLVQEATEHNPEILAARRAVEAKRARIPQAGVWPTPSGSEETAGSLNWKAPARLHLRFSKTTGTLVVDAQGISFQPDKGSALHWSFAEIQAMFLGSRQLSVKTYEPRGRMRPGTRQIRFELGSNIPAPVGAELMARVSRPSRNAEPLEHRQGFASLPVHHRSRWGGGSNGVLRFHDLGIDYVSETGKDSRSWRWADIQTLSNPDPYNLTVFGFLETYSFDLKAPLQQKICDRLNDEVYRHHEELRETPDTGKRGVAE